MIFSFVSILIMFSFQSILVTSFTQKVPSSSLSASRICCIHRKRFSNTRRSVSLSFSTSFTKTSPPALEGRRSSTRRRSQGESNSSISTDSDLNWETFDFSTSPKWDNRFEGRDLLHVASNNEKDLNNIHEREALEDIALQEEFDRKHRLWQDIDPEVIQKATDILRPFVKEERIERIQSVMKTRTQQTRFLFENPANPSNVWACLRTLDSFGIQHVDVVIQSGKYKGKAALSQKRGMRVAMGSAKWLTIRNHLNTISALQTIKNEGYHVICTDVNPSSRDIRLVDWDASGKKICIVMGNEEYGISQAVKGMADESFYLPMVGFAESFNLSAATAITCAHLSASSSTAGKGPLRSGDLSEKEYDILILKGYLNSINQKTARALFRKNGLVLPKELNLS